MFIKWTTGDRNYDVEHKGVVLDKLLVREQVALKGYHDRGYTSDEGYTAVAVHRYLTEELVTKNIRLVDPKDIIKIAEKEEEL